MFFVKANNKLENLPGYHEDVKSLCNTFWQRGFDLQIYANLSAEGMRRTLKELVGNQDNANSNHSIFKGYASLVVCILSHGGLDTVCGTDGESVDIQELQLIFEQCPDLKEKPKVFIIHTHFPHESIASAESPSTAVDYSSSRRVIKVKPPYPDFVQLLCHSFVYPKYGTNFVQCLCYHLRFFNRLNSNNGLRDIYEAYQAMRQEIAKEMLTGGNCLGVNTSPILYLSTVESDMMVGFKAVPLQDRCKQICYYANNSDRSSSYQDLVDFITTLNNKPELKFYTSKYSTDR